jgi:hypothetical protein
MNNQPFDLLLQRRLFAASTRRSKTDRREAAAGLSVAANLRYGIDKGRLFILSLSGQQILATYGFSPIGIPQSSLLLVQVIQPVSVLLRSEVALASQVTVSRWRSGPQGIG